jgi:hypothetical protein
MNILLATSGTNSTATRRVGTNTMKPNRKIDPKEFYKSIRMTLPKKDIMTFVSGLHEIQEAMIEELVSRKEAQGFPEATEVINHIRSL